MLDAVLLALGLHQALRGFWKSARGFWHGPTARHIGLAATAVWTRMTFQKAWRGWVSRHPIAAWLGDERYRRIDLWNGEHQNAEYRLAEGARLATDAPIDLRIGLLASVITDDEGPALIDNFPRLAECLSSANRVGNLLTAFDRLEPAGRRGG
jgi:hypothetical protein